MICLVISGILVVTDTTIFLKRKSQLNNLGGSRNDKFKTIAKGMQRSK